jgi:hypothetical protein
MTDLRKVLAFVAGGVALWLEAVFGLYLVPARV